jgi:spore coat protein CotH
MWLTLLLATCQGQLSFIQPQFSSWTPGVPTFVPRAAFPATTSFSTLPSLTSFSTFASNFGSLSAPIGVSTYNPNPVPPDPTADRALTQRLTSYTDLKLANLKGNEAQIKGLFDQGSFRSYNMEITPENLAIMTADPSKEVKVHCRFTVDYNTPEAKTFTHYGLGCGYKGSVGSLRVCLDEYHRDNNNCRKLSMRVETSSFKDPANKTAPKIYGLNNLLFNGMPLDWSMMSERTAYNLLGSLGIIAPMASHAKLFLNGKYLGVYAFVQNVDSTFTKMHFETDKSKGKGELYKDLWLNPLHMRELAFKTKKDDLFMKEVMAAIEATPVYGSAAQALFDRYFDTESLIDSTAFNTIIGNTDDWRQRHNFYWYVRDDIFGKKLVFIPWDYDRLYDEMASTRGALRGNLWWNIAGTTGGGACTQPTLTPSQQAASIGGSPAMIAYNTDIFNQYPPDLTIPVTCDKITQLMAQALGPRIRAKTLDFSRRISMTRVRANWATWSNQISTAVANDPDGPTIAKMQDEQRKLDAHHGLFCASFHGLFCACHHHHICASSCNLLPFHLLLHLRRSLPGLRLLRQQPRLLLSVDDRTSEAIQCLERNRNFKWLYGVVCKLLHK